MNIPVITNAYWFIVCLVRTVKSIYRICKDKDIHCTSIMSSLCKLRTDLKSTAFGDNFYHFSDFTYCDTI